MSTTTTEVCKHGYTRCAACTHRVPEIQGNDSGFEKVELPKDMINQPSHYNYGAIECIDAIKGMLGEEGFKAYCRGNAMKYTWRAGLKFDEVEDLKKASWYNRMAAGDDPRKDPKAYA